MTDSAILAVRYPKRKGANRETNTRNGTAEPRCGIGARAILNAAPLSGQALSDPSGAMRAGSLGCWAAYADQLARRAQRLGDPRSGARGGAKPAKPTEPRHREAVQRGRGGRVQCAARSAPGCAAPRL
jgi:hypothetical protein